MAVALPVDFVSAKLASPYAPGGTSVTLGSGQGAQFGSVTVDNPVRFSLVAASAVDQYGNITDATKVAHLTATGRSADTLTGVAFDSGTDQGFATNDNVWSLVTASLFQSLSDLFYDRLNTKVSIDYSNVTAPTYALGLAVLTDANAVPMATGYQGRAPAIFFGSDHPDGSGKPKLCRLNAGGTVTPIG